MVWIIVMLLVVAAAILLFFPRRDATPVKFTSNEPESVPGTAAPATNRPAEQTPGPGPTTPATPPLPSAPAAGESDANAQPAPPDMAQVPPPDQIDTNSVSDMITVGNYLLEMDDLDGAVAAYRRAVELNEEDED